jgi:hypothetical protein
LLFDWLLDLFKNPFQRGVEVRITSKDLIPISCDNSSFTKAGGIFAEVDY